MAKSIENETTACSSTPSLSLSVFYLMGVVFLAALFLGSGMVIYIALLFSPDSKDLIFINEGLFVLFPSFVLGFYADKLQRKLVYRFEKTDKKEGN